MQLITTISLVGIAVSMVILTISAIIALLFFKKKIYEEKLHRDLALLQKIYDLITTSRKDQELIYNQAQAIQTYIAEEKALSEVVNEELRNAIYKVADVYQFIGFIIQKGLLSNAMKESFFEEEGENFGRIYRLLAPLVKNERNKPYRRGYKHYLDDLYTAYKNYLKK